MPTIRLPDGSTKSFAQPVTVAEVAESIGAGLARAALAGKVDGKLVDTSYRIKSDASVAIVTGKSPEGLDILRHSTSHLTTTISGAAARQRCLAWQGGRAEISSPHINRMPLAWPVCGGPGTMPTLSAAHSH